MEGGNVIEDIIFRSVCGDAGSGFSKDVSLRRNKT